MNLDMHGLISETSMIIGRFEQIAFGNRKQTNKHTRGRRENPSLSDSSMRTLTPIHCNHRRNTCASAPVLKEPGASPQSCDRAPQKNAKLPSPGPASTRAGGDWTKPKVLKH